MPVSIAYPEAPKAVDSTATEVSPEFKREAVNVLWSILFFMLLYLILIVVGVLIAASAGVAGLGIVAVYPTLFTIIIGLGLAGLGLMVLFFLIKFIFHYSKTDLSHLTEITEKDQPLVFEFIRKLATETGTPQPKRVYLSADVNASVFYDSGFWSMFLPIRKNLQIGLGFVNVATVSEFKAVIAHEFGHFSQKSMRLGSYVYNVNRVIFNMLYDNKGYADSLEWWANLHSVFSFFAWLTGAIVGVIQFILKKQYGFINTRYMALSRQMEFHADSVAASVSGSNSLITILRRLDLAESSYQQAIGTYNQWFTENKKATNIYPDQSVVMIAAATKWKYPIEHGLPQVTENALAESRITIKDQWASHPSTADREKHLRSLNIEAHTVGESAWSLFKDSTSLQEAMTNRLYTDATFKAQPVNVGPSDFREYYHGQVDKYSVPEGYKGFYDNREISRFDVERTPTPATRSAGLDQIITSVELALPVKIQSLNNDVATLQAIQQPDSGVVTFEFSGERKKKSDAATLLTVVNKELTEANADLAKADESVYQLYHVRAAEKGLGDEAQTRYKELFQVADHVTAEVATVEDLLKEISPLYGEVTLEMAKATNTRMQDIEGPIKKNIRLMLEDQAYAGYLNGDEREGLQKYVSKFREYFERAQLDSDAIALCVNSVSIYRQVMQDHAFAVKKKMLARQLEVIAL